MSPPLMIITVAEEERQRALFALAQEVTWCNIVDQESSAWSGSKCIVGENDTTLTMINIACYCISSADVETLYV